MRRSVFAVLFVALASAALFAAESPKPAFDGKVAAVSVFKNGYGFFRVEGTAAVKDGKVELSPIPAAALGTWWFYARKTGVTVEEALAAQREISTPRAALSLDELLAANVGRDATIETEKGKFTGTLLGNSAVTKNPPSSVRPRYDEYGRPLPPQSETVFSSSVFLKTSDGVLTVRSSDIMTLSIVGGGAEFAEKKKEGFVTLYLKGASDGPCPIGFQFLQKGIRWIPSYRIELIDDKNAALVLQGEVINDIQDLDGATLQLVVGVPNFFSGDLLSPLAYLSEMPKLSEFFVPRPSADGRGGAGGYFSNAMRSQEVSAVADYGFSGGSAGPASTDFAVAPEIAGKGVSDLYYYSKDAVTLKAGERASLNILSAQLAYKDIYKWQVVDRRMKDRPEYHDLYERYARGDFNYGGNMTPQIAQRIAELSRQDMAEHFIRLTNSADKPFTSGPALVFSKSDVLAQDVLEYTPAGSTVDVRITGAPDINVSQKEEETSRSRNALNSYGNSYDLVQAKAALTVKNYKKETIHMVVTKTFDGTVLVQPEGAATTQDTSELTSVNPHTRVVWEFDLEPGASKDLSVAYSTYVRER
jgi:hypothetical protein